MRVKCDYCGENAKLVGGDVIYPHRKDLYHLNFWKCPDCVDTYVGCHRNDARVDGVISNGKLPLGRLANANLRKAKSKAHAAFDPIWRDSPTITRGEAYKMLAAYLQIPRKHCHIGMFDEDMCRKVEEFAKEHAEKC